VVAAFFEDLHEASATPIINTNNATFFIVSVFLFHG
jgi:hypothetical protein